MRIKYLAHFDRTDSKEERNAHLSAVNKLDYIFKTLSESNVQIAVISSATSRGDVSYPSSKEELYTNVSLEKLPTIKCNKKLSRILAELIFRYRLMCKLFSEVKNGDTLIVYHSIDLLRYVNILKMFKNFHLVMEVEETYGIARDKPKMAKKEFKFFEKSDGYIFASELLEKKINTKNKPAVVIYGTYNIEKKYSNKFDDGKIHCVYAGTFNPKKGGALAAVEAAKYLSDKYVLHILGKDPPQSLLDKIKNVNSEKGGQVIYEGVYKGEEYNAFLQKCHIGLSTQNPKESFNNTSFPSKILSYLANGLRVVSAPVEAVKLSKIGDSIFYYEEQSPELIAKSIANININDEYDGRSIVAELHEEFSQNIVNLIEVFENEQTCR